MDFKFVNTFSLHFLGKACSVNPKSVLTKWNINNINTLQTIPSVYSS